MSSQSSNTESLSRFPLWQVITPVRRKVILAMALAGLAALTSLGALLFLAWSLRDIRATPDAIPAWPLGGVIGCVVLTFVLRLQAFNTSHYAAFHLENILRSRLARKALQLPPGVLQQMGSGSVAKVMLDDVKSLHIFVADSTPLYARAIIMPLATIVILFWLDWRLAIATLGVLAFGSVILVLARQRSEDMAQRYHKAREQVSAAVIEFVQAMPVVRTFDSAKNLVSQSRFFSAFFLLDSESSPDPVCPDLVGIRPVALWQFRFYRVGGRFTAGQRNGRSRNANDDAQ